MKILNNIPEIPGYLIKKDGTVISKKTSVEVKPNNGSIRLTVDGGRKTFKVKKLVELTFGKERKVNDFSVQDVSSNLKDKSKKPKEEKSIESKDKNDLYLIRHAKVISGFKESLQHGDEIKFPDYKTKEIVTGRFSKHSKFQDGQPGIQVKIKVGKKTYSKIISYLSIRK